MEDWREQFLLLSEKIDNMVLSVNKALGEFTKSDAFENILEFFRSIPDDIQETELFKHISEFEKAEIIYEDIEWIQEQLGYMPYIEIVNVLKKKKDKTALDQYIISVIDSNCISEREKLIILLAHFEALAYQTMTYDRQSSDRIKKVVAQKAESVHEMEMESFKKVLITGIVFIIFSNTDKYSNSIDKRIPFRNNILHRGMLDYSDDEAQSAYELLVYFIGEFAIITK